jgi:putative endonuclease
MYYAYIIHSKADPKQTYTGTTADLRQRLADHNAGKSPHTSKFVPWELVCYIAVQDKYHALELEKYLKSHSGRAFAKKRLLIIGG